MLPDIDVLGFHFGVHYADLLGHRGLTHSLTFAAVLALAAQMMFCRRPAPPVQRGLVWLYLFLAVASHGLLDACTDNGLGVAFFSPFNAKRYFFPFTPIAVSPIGARFFSVRGFSVLLSEFRWVWLPSLAFAVATFTIRQILAERET